MDSINVENWTPPATSASPTSTAPLGSETSPLTIPPEILELIDVPAPGADDDGSGIVDLIETFRVLVVAGFRPSSTVEFHWYACFRAAVGPRNSFVLACIGTEEKRSGYSGLKPSQLSIRTKAAKFAPCSSCNWT